MKFTHVAYLAFLFACGPQNMYDGMSDFGESNDEPYVIQAKMAHITVSVEGSRDGRVVGRQNMSQTVEFDYSKTMPKFLIAKSSGECSAQKHWKWYRTHAYVPTPDGTYISEQLGLMGVQCVNLVIVRFGATNPKILEKVIPGSKEEAIEKAKQKFGKAELERRARDADEMRAECAKNPDCQFTPIEEPSLWNEFWDQADQNMGPTGWRNLLGSLSGTVKSVHARRQVLAQQARERGDYVGAGFTGFYALADYAVESARAYRETAEHAKTRAAEIVFTMHLELLGAFDDGPDWLSSNR